MGEKKPLEGFEAVWARVEASRPPQLPGSAKLMPRKEGQEKGAASAQKGRCRGGRRKG